MIPWLLVFQKPGKNMVFVFGAIFMDNILQKYIGSMGMEGMVEYIWRMA